MEIVADGKECLKKLHLGCGRTILEGWNLDGMPWPGVDAVFDLDECKKSLFPLNRTASAQSFAAVPSNT